MFESALAFGALAVFMLAGHVIYRRKHRRRSPLHVPSAEGGFRLRAPRKNAVLLGVSALFPAGLVAMLTIRSWRLDPMGAFGLLAGAATTLLLLAFAAYQFAAATRSSLVVNDSGIERIGVFRRRLVEWGSIAKIAFNPANHWFFVTIADGSHLWLPADVGGMGDFAETALRRISPDVLRGGDPVALEVLEELAGRR